LLLRQILTRPDSASGLCHRSFTTKETAGAYPPGDLLASIELGLRFGIGLLRALNSHILERELEMPAELHCDLDEMVRIGDRDTTLRSAVLEYIETSKNTSSGLRAPVWFRDRSKNPSTLNARNMETLARLPEFANI
jgi:hypothetical protein